MTTDENGTETNAIDLGYNSGRNIHDGVPNSHLGELGEHYVKIRAVVALQSFDMFGWINETVNVNGQQVIPKDNMWWKNKPDHVDVNELTADIQSPDYIYRMHEEFEIIHCRIEYISPIIHQILH